MFDEAHFPTQARFGAAWRATAATRIGASYRTNLTDGWLAGGWDQSLAAGVEQRLWFLAVRAGIAGNLDGASLLSGGLSIGGLDLGLARVTDSAAGRAERAGVIVTAGLRMH
jgi:hypothetical protein